MKKHWHPPWHRLGKYFVFRKLILSFTLFFLASLALLSALVLLVYEEWSKREMEYVTSIQLNQAGSALSQSISAIPPIMSSTLGLAYTEHFFSGTQADRVNEQSLMIHLRQLHNAYGQVHNISLVNLRTRRFLGTQGVLDDYVPEFLLEGASPVGDAMGMKVLRRTARRNLNISPSPEDDVVTFVFSPKGLYWQGAILVDVRVDYLEGLLKSGGDGAAGTLLLDGGGRVLAGSAEGLAQELWARISGEEGCFPLGSGKEKSLACYARDRDSGFYTALIMPYRRIMPFSQALTAAISCVIVVFTLSSLLLASFLVRRIYLPLNSILRDRELLGEPEGEGRGVDEFKLLYDTLSGQVQRLALLTDYQEDTRGLLGRSRIWSLLRGEPDVPGLSGGWEGESFLAAAVAIDGWDGYRRDNSPEDRRLLDFALSNILDELAREFLIECAVRMDDNLLAAAFHIPGPQLPPDLVMALRELQANLLKIFSVSVSIGLGPVEGSVEGLAHSLGEARQALRQRFYWGPASFLTPEDLRPRTKAVYPGGAEKKCMEALRQGDALRIEKAVEGFFRALEGCPEDLARSYVIRLAVRAGESVSPPSPRTDQERFQSETARIETLEGLRLWTAEYLSGFLLAPREEAPGPIQTARAYIDRNYSDYQLSVEFLAGLVGLTPAYFGRMFAQELGVSCLDYISGVRIARAAELLRGTGLTISEISAQVGISSTNYFYILFKKKYGLTPTQYRRARSKGETEDEDSHSDVEH